MADKTKARRMKKKMGDQCTKKTIIYKRRIKKREHKFIINWNYIHPNTNTNFFFCNLFDDNNL